MRHWDLKMTSVVLNFFLKQDNDIFDAPDRFYSRSLGSIQGVSDDIWSVQAQAVNEKHSRARAAE